MNHRARALSTAAYRKTLIPSVSSAWRKTRLAGIRQPLTWPPTFGDSWQGKPVVARRIGAVGRTLRWARRNRAISLLLAAMMTILLGAAIVSSYFYGWRVATLVCLILGASAINAGSPSTGIRRDRTPTR